MLNEGNEIAVHEKKIFRDILTYTTILMYGALNGDTGNCNSQYCKLGHVKCHTFGILSNVQS